MENSALQNRYRQSQAEGIGTTQTDAFQVME